MPNCRISFLNSFVLTGLLVSGGAVAANLDRAKDFFDKLNKNNLNLVDEFYDKKTVFQDPIHKIVGSEAVKNYYAGLYKNVEYIRFDYGKSIEAGDTVNLVWTMHLKAPALDKNEFKVDGVSIITFGGPETKVIFHRDYFDMGEFVYERIPILKSVIGYIKAKLSK